MRFGGAFWSDDFVPFARLCFIDHLDDGIRVLSTRLHVPRRHPAFEASAFEMFDDGFSDSRIPRRVANKHWLRNGGHSGPKRLRFAF